jgi:DNA polymerase-3 subunit epsilon
MITNFVAIDFETSYGHIPCSIGIIEFIDGVPVKEYYSLIKPIDLKFNPINSRINGIYLEDVINEREFSQIWDEIKYFFHDRIIVAHNASTDISILEKTLNHYQILKPNFKSFCTLTIARNLLNLDNYKLSTLAEYFSIEQNSYHNALEDAFVCGFVFTKFIDKMQLSKVEQRFGEECEVNKQKRKNFFVQNLVSKSKINYSENENISVSILGKTFVVSGVFEIYSRDELKKAIEDNGGKVGSSISAKTDFVIAGDNMGPAKLEKANQLKIAIISEVDFKNMVEQ